MKMDTEAFRHSPIGRLVPITGLDARTGKSYQHWAYVPAPLPVKMSFNQTTVKAMGEADRALGALNARTRLLPNPALLARPALRKEAQATSALEGTFATLEEVLKADYVAQPHRSTELKEIHNYVDAATRGIELIQRMPICLRVLEEVQGVLVSGTRGDMYDAGSLRKRQVFIGDQGQPVEQSRFVPPPNGPELEDGFAAWESWINDAGNALPLQAKLALSHYQFETLHPFSDGNGRLGRLVITLQLLETRELEYPILNLSPWFEPRRTQYIDALRDVSATGAFEPWITMFAEAVRDSSQAALATIDALLAFRDDVLYRARALGHRGHIMSVIDLLIGYPVLSIGDVHRLLKISYVSAQRSIEKLVAMGVIREITGSDYGRLYLAGRVGSIIDETPQRILTGFRGSAVPANL